MNFDFSDPIFANDVARLDQNCAELGIPKGYLMECAGISAANLLKSKYGLTRDSIVVIFCGTGNNGGDGFVIARHLASQQISVKIILSGHPDFIRTDEARLAWILLQKLPLFIEIRICSDSSQLKEIGKTWNNPTIVVDCLLGTGVVDKIKQPIASAIDLINRYSCPIIAIDVPSGMNPDTGIILDRGVKCTDLFTFHRSKVGFGGIPQQTVIPIGIPSEAHLFVGEGDLQQDIRKRTKDNYKGQYGRLLVIGGSSLYSGAPALASLAGIKFGLDLVIALVPSSISSVLRSYSPSLIVRSGKNVDISPEDIPLAQELTAWADAVVIGPGIGLSDSTKEFCDQFLPWLFQQQKPAVIDADALKILGELLRQKKIQLKESKVVLTPHAGEFKALLGELTLPPYDAFRDRSIVLQEKIQPLGDAIVLLKGRYDYIVNSNEVRINLTGCAEMAVGGTGDVLAGLTGAFLALGTPPMRAASSAAYLNGLLGEKTKAELGARLTATDLIDRIQPLLYSKKL